MPKPNKILGIDVGGTGIKGAPVHLGKGTLADERARVLTPKPATPEAVAATVAEIMRRYRWQGPVGCALPSRVRRGITETAVNIDDTWKGLDAAALFSRVCRAPVAVLNDADAAGLAEVTFGAGRGVRGVVLMLTFGTGLGSSLFVDGRLAPNLELGHLYAADGVILEATAADSARKRDALSWEAWAKERVQPALEHLEFLFAPDLIVVGGGVSKPERWKQFGHLLRTQATLRPAELGNSAGIVGAAYAAQRLLD
ncbi:MAG: polyphosphate--glucose phosphotransferase [Rubricoccaceae bacterium]